MASSAEVGIRKLLSIGEFEPYIKHIRFPQYKNLASNLKIEFSYPITALVGCNGTNKSSILKALYGAPGSNNLGNFWFSTVIDPIAETGKNASCFIYGYRNTSLDIDVEVIKTRIRKENDPDYWEPSRPLLQHGMEKMPDLDPKGVMPAGRSKTRWNTINKDVVIIDFRASLSAYDKFFYHSDLKSKLNTPKKKKEFIRTRSPHLKYVVDKGLVNYSYRMRNRVINQENYTLKDQEVKEISVILGKKYSSIKIIRHEFFNTDAYTCVMSTGNLNYTEAFAGSGEFSVVKIVFDIMNAEEKSLILLDEPEVSLHPGAQDRLVHFLEKQCLAHKHQIIISTHSPAIVRKLPPDAIKVLLVDNTTQKITLTKQESLPEEAFFHIGEPIGGTKRIIVEDKLALEIIKKSLRPLGEAVFKLFDIVYFPGGAGALWKNQVAIFASSHDESTFIYFDGDQLKSTFFSPSNTIPACDNEKLGDIIQSVTGAKIDFVIDSSTNKEQLFTLQREFIDWSLKHVKFLPFDTPEEFIWKNMKPDDFSATITMTDYKANFEQLCRLDLQLAVFEGLQSNQILATQTRRLASIPDDHPELKKISDALLSLLSLMEKN